MKYCVDTICSWLREAFWRKDTSASGSIKKDTSHPRQGRKIHSSSRPDVQVLKTVMSQSPDGVLYGWEWNDHLPYEVTLSGSDTRATLFNMAWPLGAMHAYIT